METIKNYTEVGVNELLYQVDATKREANIWIVKHITTDRSEIEESVTEEDFDADELSAISRYYYFIIARLHDDKRRQLHLYSDESSKTCIRRRQTSYFFTSEEEAARYILDNVADFNEALDLLRIILTTKM